MVSMIWPSVNASPCQRKCDSRSIGALVTREPTMNRSPASSSCVEVGRREHPGVGDDDHVGQVVAGLELPRRSGRSSRSRPCCPRSSRSRGGTRAGRRAARPRSAGRRGVPWRTRPCAGRLPSRPRSRAWSRRRAQRHIAGAHGVGEARGRDLCRGSGRAWRGPGCVSSSRSSPDGAQVGQDPAGVEQRGRLHDPSDHQVPEDCVCRRRRSRARCTPPPGRRRATATRSQAPCPARRVESAPPRPS